MKAVERKLNKAQIATIWLLIISVLLATAYVTSIVIINKIAKKSSGAGSQQTLEPIGDEVIYVNQLMAYPIISSDQFVYIDVTSEDEKYGVSRDPNDTTSCFYFHYYEKDENGNIKEERIPYIPPIVGAEGEFNYENLYSIEKNDGIGRIPYLTYLCSAIGTPVFAERINLPSKDTEQGRAQREALLKEYGITQSSTMVSFTFGERDKETGKIIEDSIDEHVIVIGKKAVSGSGYYFWVDGRDCIYYTNREDFKYALGGFASFVNGMLVAEGRPGESMYGPYLTTDFKEWAGTVFDKTTDTIFTSDMDGYRHFENPTVIVNGSYNVSTESEGLGGYETDENISLTFDLEALKEHPQYNTIKNALVGKNVGDQADPIVITLLTELYNSNRKIINFGENDSVGYTYTITKIESVITDSGEITTGTVDTSVHNLIKVTYNYTVGEKTVTGAHGVIDINNLSDKTAFDGKAIGQDLGTGFTLNVTYTKNNALSSTEKFVLGSVISIFDEDGAATGVITENSYVTISYRLSLGSTPGETKTMIIRLADIKADDKLAPIKDMLLGKGKDSYNKTVYEEVYYYEFVRDFGAYTISKIDRFIANEMIVSFEFVNASERDPFYGDTFYKNTLKNEYGYYGLNAGTCETAVELLGGIGGDTSTDAAGFAGETVAIGLSIANMKKYGLYAHKIYFEMPRGLYDKTESMEEAVDQDALSDFAWHGTLGFTLYISDPTYDEETGAKIRYIGSDMYDVIAKVDSDQFDFVEYGFVEFWARRSMVMIDIAKLDQIKLEFNMTEMKGDYTFDIYFSDAYGAYIDGELDVKYEEIDGYKLIEDYQEIRVTASENAYETEFKKMYGTNPTYLSALYNKTLGNGKPSYYPESRVLLSSYYFNSVYEILQFTSYLDCLTKEEQEEGRSKPKVMSMKLKVDGADKYYTYDFYRIDDRRVMVSLYRSDANGVKDESYGEVSDFYITTFAFKKLVNNYIALLNGKEIDGTIGYLQ